MADYRCYACGAELRLLHTRNGQEPFWGCASYPECEVTFDGDEDGPVRTRAWEGFPVQRRLRLARDELLLDASSARLPRQRETALIGMILDSEDLLELGDLRHQLQRAGRGQGS